ncbi:GTPase Era [Tessaracoccus rhinocerotis]|uniref:GTPase Era n=1 Tax=Tessaracoccus rhinocerotis TaxID=1689449 RepID=A0A553K480_9ACTN|nr:GTPase Era [Tessaracoccus rhinocerotis]TRY19508.1 GTPase Era [Tessaracoccus rhinocerotis]
MTENQTPEQGFRSGFACFVGRPNAGKSTLTNALVGQKIAIASSKPQTTRHVVRGIITRPDGQLVLIDTPGLHKPRTLLGERLNDLVKDTWSEVDIVGICLPCDQRIGPGDTFIAKQIAELENKPKVIAIATKTDLVSKDRVLSHLVDIAKLGEELGIDWAAVVPCSAELGDQLDDVERVLLDLLPEGPAWYPEGEITDEPEETLIAELIREAALEGVRDELPHSIAVMIDEILPRADRPEDKPLLDVFATIVVERDSQKGIVIGHRGARLKDIGTQARHQINRLLGTPVHLSLHVKVLKEWQRDAKYLNRLGF